MDTLGVSQTDMQELAGWSKTTASLTYNCRQDYNPSLIASAARALNLHNYELLLPPEEAMHIRRLRQAVEEEHRLRAAETSASFTPAPDPEAPLNPKRRAS